MIYINVIPDAFLSFIPTLNLLMFEKTKKYLLNVTYITRIAKQNDTDH